MSDGLGIHRALCAIKTTLANHGGVTKERDAPMGYKYRGIEDFDDILCGITAKHGVMIYPRVTSQSIEYQASGHGKLQTHVFLTVEWTFVCAEDGSREVVSTIGEALDTSDKACNKAIQASRKYALLSVLQIPTSGDDTEAYASTVAPPPAPPPAPSVTPVPAAIEGPGPAKAKGRPKKQPKPDTTEAWVTEGVVIPEPEALMARIGEVNTFPLLYAFAQEADPLTPGVERDEVFRAIRDRGVYLFSQCQSAAEVKQGLALYRHLGSPEELGYAGNQAYARFRNGPTNEAS